MAPKRPLEPEIEHPVPEENEEGEDSESEDNVDEGDSSDSDGGEGEESNDGSCVTDLMNHFENRREYDDSFFEKESIRLLKPLGWTESAMRACVRSVDPAVKERLLRRHAEIQVMLARNLARRHKFEADVLEALVYGSVRRTGR